MSQPYIYCDYPVRGATSEEGRAVQWVCELCGAQMWILYRDDVQYHVYQEHMANSDRAEVHDQSGCVIEIIGTYRPAVTVEVPAGCLFAPKSEAI